MKFPLRIIGIRTDYERASTMFSRVGAGEKINQETNEYLRVLVNLIAEYGSRAIEIIPRVDASASDVMRHLISKKYLTISSLAREIGMSHSNVSEMISGQRD